MDLRDNNIRIRGQGYKGLARRALVLAGLVILCLSVGATAQSSLPPKVQADLLQQQIVDALKGEDVKTALTAFDKYHALKVTIPPPLLFLEAKAAWAAGDALRAFRSLEAFLKVSPQEGKQYSEALVLYPQYEEAARPAMEKEKAEAAARAQAARAKAKAQAAAEQKAKAEAEAARLRAEKAECDSNPACNVVDQGAGVLKQVAKGLEWTQSDNGSDIDWTDATTYCASKSGGWRLPSINELLSLYDASGKVSTSCGSLTCKVSPLFHLTSFWFWSNEINGSSEAWYVAPTAGARHSRAVSYSPNRRALCVRGS